MSDRRTSAVWFLLAIVPLFIGGALAVHYFFGIRDGVEGMKRVDVPGEHEIELSAGEYVIFGETSSGFRTTCRVSEPASLSAYGGTMTYNMFGRSGFAMFDLDVPESGTYTLTCEGDDTGTIAIGHGFGAKLVLAILCPIAGFFLTVGGVVVVALKRSRRPPLSGGAPTIRSPG